MYTKESPNFKVACLMFRKGQTNAFYFNLTVSTFVFSLICYFPDSLLISCFTTFIHNSQAGVKYSVLSYLSLNNFTQVATIGCAKRITFLLCQALFEKASR